MREILNVCALLLIGLLQAESARAATDFITLASTTSTQASGFFDYFLPLVKAWLGVEVRVVAVGTGQALKLGERGDADVLLVHDRIGELAFMQAGFGVDRREVMYNDFVLVGPRTDPAGVRGGRDAAVAFSAIGAHKTCFASRADDSGTHRAELRLWHDAGVDVHAASGTWYRETGAGMGATLNVAAGLDCYLLADRATWLSFHNRQHLILLVEGDSRLFNQYSLIRVNPARHPYVKQALALKFVDFMTSPIGQRLIGDFRITEVRVFVPNYVRGGPST